MSIIVVIEDDPNSARLASRLLERAGHQVITAMDGETGLNAVSEHSPDLVLVDLGLPDFDGQTVIGLLHEQPTPRPMSILAFTAWPEETAQVMAEAYGCDGLISKPINTRTFADQVAVYLPKGDTTSMGSGSSQISL